MILKAYAKINLGLWIINKREDGYHNLQTIFHKINFFDELEVKTSQKTSIETNDNNLPKDGRNLCIKAVRLFNTKFQTNLNVKIILKKNIPIGAGLGGGSSDAAIVLRALSQLTEKKIEHKELMEAALELGSDVPYFLNEGTAFATGRGEILDYFCLSLPYWILTVTPLIHISTKWAYKNLRLKDHQKNDLRSMILENISNLNLIKDLVTNDFEDFIFENYPEIKNIKKSLYESGAKFALLSGSGSTVFALYEDKEAAEKTQERFKNIYITSLTDPYFSPQF